MPMGTGPEDTGHGPRGPQGGSLEDPPTLAQRRVDLERQLRELNQETDTPAESVHSPSNPAARDSLTPSAPVGVSNQQPASPAPVSPDQQDENKPFSHWLHLADGRVIKSLGTVTHWFDDDNPNSKGTPVIAAVANPNYVHGDGDKNARLRSLLAELSAITGADFSHLTG